MRRLLCILLILMHIVEINICMYFIFWKIILNHENVLLASLLHPADLDALFWKTLKNVEHMPYLIVIFVYWGLIFFLVAQIFYKRYQQIISTCGADVKHQVWQMPNVLFLCYCYVQVLPTKHEVSDRSWSMAPLVTFTHITMEWLKSLFQRNTFPLFTYVAIS